MAPVAKAKADIFARIVVPNSANRPFNTRSGTAAAYLCPLPRPRSHMRSPCSCAGPPEATKPVALSGDRGAQIAKKRPPPLSCRAVPAYDYSCQTCGTRFEVIQSFSEDSLTVCPQADSIASPAACTHPGRGQVAKVFSVPSITFKGDGFYRNDSRSGAKSSTTAGSSTNGDSSNGPDKPDAAKSDAAKSDAAKSASSSAGSSSREPAKAASSSSDD